MHPTSKSANSPRTGLSLVVLACLALITAGVLYTQTHFNPAVLQWQQLTAGDAEPPSAGLDSQQSTLIELPDQLAGLTPPEIFDRETLSDKIDGKAELYLSSGFERLESQRFSLKGATRPWLEMFSYNMGQFENAYSVFSVQRREKAASVDLVEYAYQTENALFLVHGPYYLEIIASEPTGQMLESMALLAGAFVDQVKVAQESITENQLFPAEGLVAGSIARIPANAFGHERLDKVFTAQYRTGDAEMTAYFSRRDSDAEAVELARVYEDFLIRFGGEKQNVELSIETAAVINILDTYEIVFSTGRFLAGVREAEDLQQASTLALRLDQHLKTVDAK